jgi:hypothetical protein
MGYNRLSLSSSELLVIRLCSLSGILETRKQHFGNWICCRPQVREGGEMPALLGPLALCAWGTGEVFPKRVKWQGHEADQ